MAHSDKLNLRMLKAAKEFQENAREFSHWARAYRNRGFHALHKFYAEMAARSAASAREIMRIEE